MNGFTVRPAMADDREQFAVGAAEYVEESAYPYSYNREATDAAFDLYLTHPDCGFLLAVTDTGEAAGTAMLGCLQRFVDQPIGFFTVFYVRKAFRRTVAGRRLVEAANAWFDQRGCVDVSISVTGRIGQDGLLEALMGKYGYRPAGAVLMRERT